MKAASKPKGRDPLTKRFTNGHKCFTAMQSQFMVEIMAKDEAQRLHFEDNKFVLQKPRDPVACELTARDNAPFLVKFEVKPEVDQSLQKTKTAVSGIIQDSAMQGTKQMLRVVSEMARCESLKTRKKLINDELDMVQSILDHKRVCSYSGFTGAGAPPPSTVMANSRTRDRRPF